MSTNYPLPALIIFIDNPEKGLVMPRLAADAGEDAALRVYEQLLTHTRMVTQHFPGGKYLFYAGYPNWNDAWDIGVYRKRVQQGASVGERMHAAFEAVFEEGHSQIILIGSDCYELNTATIRQATEALDDCDVVIGPAQQGGYYLLGMKSLRPALFTNMPGNTESVLAQTIYMLEKTGLTCHMLPVLREIHTAADLAQSSLPYE